MSFVVSTTVLAVGASRVANDPGEAGSWLLMVGAAILLYCSEFGRDVEAVAVRLATSSTKDLVQTRADTLAIRHPLRFRVAILTGIGLMVGGMAVQAVRHSEADAPSSRTPAPISSLPSSSAPSGGSQPGEVSTK